MDKLSVKPEFNLSSLQQPILLGSLAFGILGFVLPIYGKQLGASAVEIGGLFSVFSIMTVLFRPHVEILALAFIPSALVYSFLPSHMGRLSDRFGRVPLMAMGLAAAGLVSLLLPGLPSLVWLIVLWVVEAIGLTAAAPAQEALVADLTGNDVRGTGYGLYTFAASVGATFGPLVGGWLYDAAGHATPFYLNGIVLLAGTLAVWVLLRGKSSQALPQPIG